MNHKELITNVATKMNVSKEEVQELLGVFLDSCVSELKDDKVVDFQSFGTFEVVKKEERVLVHPQTKERSLVPPRLVPSFRQSAILNEKINTKL